jgi:hypothetical protein
VPWVSRQASTDSVDGSTAEADPTSLVTLAKGLYAQVVTARRTPDPTST